MNNLAIQPEIDFKYWYEYSKGINQEKNENDEPKIKRHYDVINMVYEKYTNGIKTVYFTQYNNENDVVNEVNRLKKMSYFELENEIISLINEVSSFDFYIDNDSEIYIHSLDELNEISESDFLIGKNLSMLGQEIIAYRFATKISKNIYWGVTGNWSNRKKLAWA
jgi:hypothetical protein